MENNGRIRFLRANTSNLDSTKKLKAGQPLYIADKNYLTVGNLTDDNKASNAQPIDARRIHGYTSDNSTLNNTNTGEYTIEPYTYTESNATKSGVEIKAPDQVKVTIGNRAVLNVNKNDITINPLSTLGIEDNPISTIYSDSNVSSNVLGDSTSKKLILGIENGSGYDVGNILNWNSTTSKVDTTTYGDILPNENATTTDNTTTGRNIGSANKKFDKIYAQSFKGNASTVTNGVYTTDFNTANATQFGDYIIEKREILWQGQESVDSTTTTKTIQFNSNKSIASGDVVEFRFRFALPSSINWSSSEEFIVRKIAKGVGGTGMNMLIDVLVCNNSSYENNQVFFNFWTIPTGFISTNSFKFKLGYTNSIKVDNGTFTFSHNDINVTFTSIVKIISNSNTYNNSDPNISF